MERDLTAALEEIAAGGLCDREIHGLNVKHWLAELVGSEVRPRFFAAIREVKEGLTKKGCLLLESQKSVKDLHEPAPKFIPLDKFSSIVSAFDRALSHVVVAYANADPAMDTLCQGHVTHSGLLIRALLGETDAVRTLYPKHVVGISNNPELDESLIAKTHHAYEDGLMARLCAKHYGLDEDTLQTGLEKTVSIQQRILPLLPFKVHRLVDALEARIRLKKLVEKHQTSGRRSMNQAQVNNLRATLRAQALRGQEITKGLKASFHVDLAKMFCLDESLLHEIEILFGNELRFLRTVLANYVERGKTESDSDSTLEPDSEA